MKLDKKSILIGMGVLVLSIFLAVAAFLLIRGIMRFNDSEIKLGEAKRRLKELYDGKPFGSQANIEREKDNITLLSEWFEKLAAALRKGQVEPEQKSPSTFMNLLQDKRPELIRKANESMKVVPNDFAFGFERYLQTSSALPEPNDVARLTQQLKIIEKICDVLFSEKIESLSVMHREIFEEAPSDAGAAAPGGAGKAKAGAASKLMNKGAGLLGEEDLYAKFRFQLEFKARESAALGILNKLASHEMFIVISSVDIKKEGSDLEEMKARIAPVVVPAAQPQVATAQAAGAFDPFEEKPAGTDKAQNVLPVPAAQSAKPAAQEKPDREARIVCGPDLERAMKVKVELDVYRFRGE